MKGDRIRYRRGYKYQLVNDYRVRTDIRPDYDIKTEFVQLERSGVLTIRHGYAWDGPSGPTFDTANFMRGSLVHDSLAGLMRDAYLEREKWFAPVNRELQKICIEDGMWRTRAVWVFIGVEYLGGKSWVQWGDGGKKLCEAP
jgi:hypothetical protein